MGALSSESKTCLLEGRRRPRLPRQGRGALLAQGCGLSLLLTFFPWGRAAAQDSSPKLEVGPQFTQVYVPKDVVGSVTFQPALGGIFSANIAKRLGFDSAYSLTPKAPNQSSSFAGGRLTQAFFGARAGISWGRVTYYAKLRPGVVSFGSAILKVTPPPNFLFQFGRLTEPSLDVGGIVMVGISRRFAARYEAGDTLIFYRSRVLTPGAPSIPGRTTNNFQFAIGFLFRF